jgi:hypothetical protein
VAATAGVLPAPEALAAQARTAVERFLTLTAVPPNCVWTSPAG